MRRTAEPDARVLILDGDPAGLPAPVEVLLGAVLDHTGAPIDLDVLRRPAAALRVITAVPDALDRYSAVVAVVSAASRADALEQAARRLASRVPTLLIMVRPDGADPEPDDGTSDVLRVVALTAGVQAGAAAERIRAGLDRVLAAADPGRSPDAPTLHARPLSTVVLNRLGHITQLAATAFDLAAAELNLVDGDDLVTVTAAGADPKRLALHESLCVIALGRPGITVIPDTRLDADARQVEVTTGDGAIRFYAGVPLHDEHDALIGTLCIYDHSPHEHPEFDFGFLHDLALLAEGELIDAERRAS